MPETSREVLRRLSMEDEADVELEEACQWGRLASDVPVPMRGREGEPALVGFTAAALADLRLAAGLAKTKEETYQALWENGSRLFYR